MKNFDKVVIILMFLTIFFIGQNEKQARADVGGSLAFSLTKGDAKVTPGMISCGNARLIDGSTVSFFPNDQVIGLTTGSQVNIFMSFIPGDEENDLRLVEKGELRIEGYLQGSTNIPMRWVPSVEDYFVGHYEVTSGNIGAYNVVVKLWSTRGVTEWVVVFIPFDTHQEGNTLFSPYSINISAPTEKDWEKHPVDYCGNVFATDGSGYYSWTDAKQQKFIKSTQQQSVQSSQQPTTSALFQQFLEIKTAGGKAVKETNGFFFICEKPFCFLTVVTDPSDSRKELFRGKVKLEEWKEVADGLFVFVPTFSNSGRVFIDEKTVFVQNSSQVTEKVGEMTTFLHDFSKYQVVEIFSKGGN